MSVVLTCSPEALDVSVEGLDRLWGFRRRIEIPISRVVDVKVMSSREAKADLRLRVGGLGFPGVAAVGHFRGGLHRRQWCRVYRAERVLVVDLAPESEFDRLVLEVPDPEATADAVWAARSASRR